MSFGEGSEPRQSKTCMVSRARMNLFDQFSYFAEITEVPNTQTHVQIDRGTYDMCSNNQRLCDACEAAYESNDNKRAA